MTLKTTIRRVADCLERATAPARRALHAMALRHNIRGFERDLEVIAAERKNGYDAEKIICMELALAKSALRSLEARKFVPQNVK